MRSAVHKLDEIRATLLSKSIDVFVCSESWFSENLDERATAIDNYVCFRDDRVNRIGGGVALWVRCSILSCRLPCTHPNGFECLIVKLPSLKIIIMALYVPPHVANSRSSSVNDFITSSLDECMMLNPEFGVVIAGDLNKLDVSSICSSFDLCNKNNRPTYGNSELDYILLSGSLSDNYVLSLCAPLDRSKVPHKTILATPFCRIPERTGHLLRRVYDLRSSHVERFVEKIDTVDWCFMDDEALSLNDKCSRLQSILESATRECIPISFVKCSMSDKPWITPMVKDLINKRWSAFRRRDFAAYERLKNKVHVEIQKAKFLWTKKMQERDIWKAVNTHLGRSSSSPILSLLFRYNSMTHAVDCINEQLFSVFIDSNWAPVTELLGHYSQEDKHEWMPNFSRTSILEFLQKLSKHKSSPDIPNVLYRSIASQLADPLSKLLKLSFDQSVVPDPWKTAIISPIPKTRCPSIEDIRPISLLPPLAKIMERVVLNSIKSQLLENYDSCQFGFRPYSSTQCSLTFLHHCVTSYLDDPSTFGVLIISYDYSKAFDRLRGDIVIRRMIECKFPSKVIAWMMDYLTGRKQYVRIGDVVSRPMEITSGVPQGSILGPFLYAFATATYSPTSNDCHVMKYADDTSLIFPLYKTSDNNHVLDEHRHLLKWSAEIDLKMNISKCKALVVRKPNVHHSMSLPFLPDVQLVDKLMILGLVFNSKFTWSHHIDYIVKKCSRLLFAFRTIRSALTSIQLRLLYCSLVRSVIDYCSPVYIGLSSLDSSRLEYLQKRFHRLICSSSCDEHCLEALSDRRLKLAMKFLMRIMSGEDHILRDQLPSRSRSGRFILPPRRTERRSRTFFLYICEKYNILAPRGVNVY